MEHFKSIIFFLLILILAACSNEMENVAERPMFQAHTSFTLETMNQINWFDLGTGEIVASYEFGENDDATFSGELADGYFYVWARTIDPRSYAWLSGIYQEGKTLEEMGLEPLAWEDRNHRVYLFDENFTLVEVFPFAPPENVGFLLNFQDGNLYAYLLENADFIRWNLGSGDKEVLFRNETEHPLRLGHMIDENHILVESNTAYFEENRVADDYSMFFDGTGMVFGSVNIETGEFNLRAHREGPLNSIILSNGKILLTEFYQWGRGKQLNEAIVVDAKTLEATRVPFPASEGIFASLSLDGNHIVTVASHGRWLLDEPVFTKYALNGEIVVEVPLDLPEDFWLSSIVALSGTRYALIFDSGEGLLVQHVDL